MGKPPKALVTKKRTVIMYAELWHASKTLLQLGQKKEPGYSYQFMSSALLTTFAFEAYLNHTGPLMLKSWAIFERLPPLAKFEVLCELMNVKFKTGARPLQTLEELIKFRNAMAHGKTEIITPVAVRRDVNAKLDQQLGERPLKEWERLIQNEDFAIRARVDVEDILTGLHAARSAPKEPLFYPGVGLSAAKLVGD